ncbi:hypothetical protein [Paeniglutamicibacter terrestris]|uniref:Uncharacterized protein n=1 Tax=Paeniglutamicibacter terrestris TaxID=2723403 RepID=A0ABX1G544_9MICC|nr:hypothetical protein [Paeniglutamicibacter terrestris]NKG21128.1 hypothetical protein [Paeniglutamicibacter terrestris]
MTDQTAPPLDLTELKGWVESGIRIDVEHALQVIARAESAEAKVARVEHLAAFMDEHDGGDSRVVKAIREALGGAA